MSIRGIAGYFGTSQQDSVLKAMLATLWHRGGSIQELYTDAPVFMGVCRKEASADVPAPPPCCRDEHGAIAFDGCLCNRDELLGKLREGGKGLPSGGTDAHLALALYHAFGAGFVADLRGAFAFAIHDRDKDLVLIARDQMGQRPLYYTTTPSGTFVFASEIKALFTHPGMSAQPDLVGIDAFLTLHYSPGPQSMFRGVHKLQPGHRLFWNPGLHALTEPYWQWEHFQQPDPSLKSDADYDARFKDLFEESVRLRLMGGGKAGIFLSGGIDSSTIAAVAARQAGTGAVHTFFVDAGGQRSDAETARVLAENIGTVHHEVACTSADMGKLPDLIRVMDEPLSDPVIVPMMLAAREAVGQVDAILSGDGADEMMFGYYTQKALLRAKSLPRFAYDALRTAADYLPAGILEMMFDYPGRMGARSRRKLVDFLSEMKRGSLGHQYLFLISLFDNHDKRHVYSEDMSRVIDTFLGLQKPETAWPTDMASIIALQRNHWLADETLFRLERILAAQGIEARAPFLDRKLVEFLLSVPDHLRMQRKTDKVLLRRYAAKVLPDVASRPRKPFYAPIEKYIASQPLKEMIEHCLSEASVNRRGLFSWSGVRHILENTHTGDFIYAKQVFSLLCLELWFRIHIDREKGW